MLRQLPCILVLLLLSTVLPARAVTVSIDAQDNIYGAGIHGMSPGGGLPPVGIAVSPGDVLTFQVTGTVSMNIGTGSNYNDPDGVGAAVPTSSNTGYGSISGLTAPNAGYLVGVFVPAAGPSGPAPAPLDFTGPGATAFTSLSPQLDQVFFIGDGLTGDGSGARQQFHVPAGAGALYLGISDAGGYNGPPSWYQDNQGTFQVIVTTTPHRGLTIVASSLAVLAAVAAAALAWLRWFPARPAGS
jgi:hypothetical protein